MSCPYYKYESSLFGGDYYCIKQEKAVNSDTYYKYCRNYDYADCPIYKHQSSSGGCFLTSACAEAKGLPDNCCELQTLRFFRDNWLSNTEDGPTLIARYYEIAPKIVAVIDTKNNRLEIYEKIYVSTILPCVNLIQQRRYSEALVLYQNTILKLEEQYC